MKIKIAKKDLEAALSVTSITVGSGSDLSSHYLFRTVPDKEDVEVLSYDMRVFSRAPLMGASLEGEGGSFTVEAWRLDKWLSAVGDGVLTLAVDESGSVSAKGPRSKVKFRSLDPSKFPYWDGLLTNATEIGDVDPNTLHRALTLSRSFVSTDDTTRPEICQTEATAGVLQATNRRAVCSIKVKSLPSLNIRISGKDLAAVQKFLSDKTTQEGSVEVREASRSTGSGSSCAIFSRPDGSYLGVSRPTAEMPKLDVTPEESEVKVTLNVDEFAGAIAILLASAPKKQETVTFAAKDGGLVLSMPSAAGGMDEYPMVHSTQENLGDVSFHLDYDYIKSIVDLFDLDTITLGVHARGRGGFVSFICEEDEKGNDYYTVIVWRNEP